MHIIICELRGKEPISCIPVSKKKNQFLHLCSTRFTNLYPNIASYPAVRKGQAALSWFKALFGVQE